MDLTLRSISWFDFDPCPHGCHRKKHFFAAQRLLGPRLSLEDPSPKRGEICEALRTVFNFWRLKSENPLVGIFFYVLTSLGKMHQRLDTGIGVWDPVSKPGC